MILPLEAKAPTPIVRAVARQRLTSGQRIEPPALCAPPHSLHDEQLCYPVLARGYIDLKVS
jgi:hypothetical protein